MLASIRGQLGSVGDRRVRLALLDASLTLEQDLFLTGNTLIDRLPRASRKERLEWLRACANGLYGMALFPGVSVRVCSTPFEASPVHPSDGMITRRAERCARVPGWRTRCCVSTSHRP